jgi:hypothetical protein
MNGKSMLIVTAMMLLLAVVSAVATSAQDKYTLKLPDGIAFSDFRGYEDWQLISSSKTDDRLKGDPRQSHDNCGFQVRYSGQRQAVPRGLQDRKGPVETEEEHGSPVRRRRAGYFGRPFLHGEGQQEICGRPEDGDTPSLTMTRRRPLTSPMKAAPPRAGTCAM